MKIRQKTRRTALTTLRRGLSVSEAALHQKERVNDRYPDG